MCQLNITVFFFSINRNLTNCLKVYYLALGKVHVITEWCAALECAAHKYKAF